VKPIYHCSKWSFPIWFIGSRGWCCPVCNGKIGDDDEQSNAIGEPDFVRTLIELASV